MSSPVRPGAPERQAPASPRPIALGNQDANTTRLGISALEAAEERASRLGGRALEAENQDVGSRTTPISGTAVPELDLAMGEDNASGASATAGTLSELKRARDLADARTLIGGTNPSLAVPLEPELNTMQRAEPILVAPDARVPEFGSLRPSSLAASSAAIGSKHLWLLLVGALISAGIGGVIALLTRDVPVISVKEFSVNPEGNDRLKVECISCDDGTRIRLGVASGTVRDGQAELLLERKLRIGPNQLRFSVEALDGKLSKAKPIVLPIAFRMTTRWVVDDSQVPIAEIVVDAPSDSTLLVGGEKLNLSDQQAKASVPFRDESVGQSPNVLPLHVDIPVVVEHDGQRKESRAVMTGGICPLTFKTTGIDVGGRTFQIEGTSAPRARLTIGLEKFHAGQDGHFSFRFESEQPSQLEIVARTDELLPRRAALNISR